MALRTDRTRYDSRWDLASQVINSSCSQTRNISTYLHWLLMSFTCSPFLSAKIFGFPHGLMVPKFLPPLPCDFLKDFGVDRWYVKRQTFPPSSLCGWCMRGGESEEPSVTGSPSSSVWFIPSSNLSHFREHMMSNFCVLRIVLISMKSTACHFLAP